MNDTDYCAETIDCWSKGQAILFAGKHRNDPTQYVERLRTDGQTIWSYGQPLVHNYNGSIILNLTPYIITADDRASRGPRTKFLSLSKATLKHQHQITTWLYCRPSYKEITKVMDFDGTSRPNATTLERYYQQAANGVILTTLDDYIEWDYYTPAMRAAKQRVGTQVSSNASFSPLNAFATLEIEPGVWRKVNVTTGEVIRTVAEMIADLANEREEQQAQ